MRVLTLVALGLVACGGVVHPGLGTGGGGAGGSTHDASGGDAGDAGPPLALPPADIARRLSLFLFERAPDGELLRQVYDPPVTTKADVRALATRMLADPRARAGVRRFFHQWLQLDGLAAAKKNPTTFPEDSPALRAAMVAEAEEFALYVTFEGDGRFTTLLTADFGMLDSVVAPLYGVAGVTERRKVALDPAQRAGVFTLAGVLANVMEGSQPPVSARGLFVLSLLCEKAPPGPPGMPPSPPPAPGQTTRDWLAEVLQPAPCAPCHRLMDPLGLAFGNYDALGRFSTTERGQPV